MLDIKLIRERPDEVRQGLEKRGADSKIVDHVIAFDDTRRDLLGKVEELKSRRNTVSKQIGQLRKEGADTSEIQASMRALGDEISNLDNQIADVEKEQNSALLSMPNLPAQDVVPGGKESNEVVKTWGNKPAFEGFEPNNHVDLCTSLGLIDYERGVKMGGTGFWLYTGVGAQLEWALLNYFITEHVKDGYTFMLPPHLLTYECGITAGQFPKFEEDVFRLTEFLNQKLLELLRV